MHVAHVTSSLSAQSGGPPRVVGALTKALTQRGVRCTIFAADKRGREDPNLLPDGSIIRPEGVDTKLFAPSWLARWWTAHSHGIGEALAESMARFDLVHIHDLWHHPHYAAAREASRAKVPYVVSPHGTFQPWALNYKQLKKRLYGQLIQRKILENAAVLHAMTQAEAGYVRDFGLTRPITVIPSGIDSKEFDTLPPKEAFEEKYQGLVGKRVVLFMGRLHPVKGLDVLANAFSRVSLNRDDVRLVIAGPDENGYAREVSRYLQEAGVLDKSFLTGMLRGDDRLAALARADVFAQPSYSEGFSVAVLEGLAAGRPVVISHGCCFPEVAEAGAGLIVDPDVQQLSSALGKLLDQPELGAQMGSRGRELVRERYTWDHIAGMFENLYIDVLATDR